MLMHQRIDFTSLAKRVLRRGYTTKGLGDAIGLSQPAASRLASGRTKAVSAEAAVALIYLAGGHVHIPPEDAAGAAEVAHSGAA